MGRKESNQTKKIVIMWIILQMFLYILIKTTIFSGEPV